MSNPKPVESRQRRNMPAVLDSSATVPAVPRPPSGLSAALRRSWTGLWTSPVAQLLDPVSDLPAATRLFTLYALGERIDKELAGDLDPAQVRSRLAVAAEARLLEAALGLSPRSRLALGLALLAGKKAGSLDELVDDAND